MAILNARSPKWIYINDSDLSYATLNLYVWEGSSSSLPSTPNYAIRKSSLSGESSVYFEISELVRDELDVVFNGDYGGISVWVYADMRAYNSSGVEVSDELEQFISFDGYEYFEKRIYIDEALLITNRELFVLEDNAFRVPIYTGLAPTVVFYKDGEVIASETFSSSTDSANQIKYVSIYGDSVNWDTFQERVTDANGTYESNACLQSFFDNYSIGAVDKITVSDTNGIETIKVNVIEECKYEPKKVTFINKFGALQDMYFFKKSVEMMTIEKESYKSNILNSNKTYSTSSHVNRDFNVVGSESITLSSGFLSEEYNEVFKQMMLSEKVWVTNILETGEQVLPINVKTSDITYKTSLNNKLVEYTIEFDKSFDTINNIR